MTVFFLSGNDDDTCALVDFYRGLFRILFIGRFVIAHEHCGHVIARTQYTYPERTNVAPLPSRAIFRIRRGETFLFISF